MDFDVIFCGFFGLRFEKFFNNIFYCTPHGQNRKRDVLMHVTLTIIWFRLIWFKFEIYVYFQNKLNMIALTLFIICNWLDEY